MKAQVNILLFILLVAGVACVHVKDTESELLHIYGYRQNYSAFTHQPVGEPYLWYVETRTPGMLLDRAILYSYGDTLYYWRYDVNGRVGEQWYKHYRMKFIYPADTARVYQSAETYLAKSSSGTPESIHRIDSCRTVSYPDGTHALECRETCLSPYGGIVRKMRCTYDSLFRPTGRSISNKLDELQEYFNISYDSLGRISSTSTASFADQHEERVDYFYDARGLPASAKGYLGSNTGNRAYADFIVTFRLEK